MVLMGNPVGGPRYKSEAVKIREREVALETRIARIEKRVESLEKEFRGEDGGTVL